MPTPTPERVTVRMYQVGFGDCFLLSLHYRKPLPDGRAERHVLIDFGSSHGPLKQRLDMVTVAERVAADCDGRLDAVVVTHRHKDHLSGFGNDRAAAVIGRLRPSLIVRPWTETPELPARATGAIGADSRRLLQGLSAGQAFAAELAGAIDTSARGVRGRLRRRAEDELKNAEAIERLNGWAAEGDGEYLHAGMASKLEALIPGLGVEVLGPPTADQHPDVVNARARDPEYWMLYQGLVLSGLPTGTLDALHQGDRDDDAESVPDADGDEAELAVVRADIPAGPARWLADRLRNQQVHSLARIVRTLDDALNNTSLILLFSVGRRRLLFPGDAQIENWRFTLDRLPTDKALVKRLRAVDLYKVGHHGSRNASPRSLLQLWDLGRRPMSLMSTRRDVHGESEATAVPRATLVAALRERTELQSTEDLRASEAVVVEAEARGTGGFTLA